MKHPNQIEKSGLIQEKEGGGKVSENGRRSQDAANRKTNLPSLGEGRDGDTVLKQQ